ncbi:MAG TPA: hypothetical protein VN976_12465 [Verrucomicrobiae bacterium]|nr:hypothetical protein [Verrucomicrobiae bacterium]
MPSLSFLSVRWTGAPSGHGTAVTQSVSISNVDTEEDKNAAGIYANGVPNVFSVTNNLVVTRGKKGEIPRIVPLRAKTDRWPDER